MSYFFILGSTDVERSFSILNYIRYNRCHKLDSETLNQLMFIRKNGLKDLTKFNDIPYAVYWYEIKGQTLVDDDVGFVEKNEYDF